MDSKELEKRRQDGLRYGDEIRTFEQKHGRVAYKVNGQWVSQDALYEKNRTNYARCKLFFRELEL